MGLLSTLGTGALVAAPYAIKGIGKLIGAYQRWKNPEYYERQQVLKRTGITPEQYELRRQNLEEAANVLQNQQRLFLPAQAGPVSMQDLAAGIPQQIGQEAQPVRPGGLADILGRMQQAAREGYQQDAAAIGTQAGRRFSGNIKSASTLGQYNQAYAGRATGYGKSAFDLLKDYANRNAIAEIEAGSLNARRGQAQNALQRLIMQTRLQGQGLGQQEQLNQQQQYNQQAALRNLQEQERYIGAGRKYRIGQQSPYTVEQQPKLGGI